MSLDSKRQSIEQSVDLTYQLDDRYTQQSGRIYLTGDRKSVV